jgi:16S rRNA (cytosine967-C5)-methyltransferase
MNARSVTSKLLLDWERKRPHADELLHERLDSAKLEGKDRALVVELFYGCLRRLTELDFLIARLREGELDVETRAILRLGLYQLFHTRIPTFAAVKETVTLAKRSGALVNAVLRRADRERATLQQALAAASEEVRWSHPEFLLERWQSQFGPDAVAALVAWNNSPAPVTIRANTLKTTAEKLCVELPEAQPHPFHPLALTVPRLPAEWLQQGLCYVQDPSTLAAVDTLDPQPGETILDACAAPGGKTTFIAGKMRNEGQIIACDLWESRVKRLQENCHRLGATIARCLVLDTMKESPELRPQSFDRILIDAPCSNTGVIRRRVDVRWRLTDEDFLRMPPQQMALLRRCAGLLKPGGTLVYSTCSLEAEENECLVEEACRALPNLQLDSKRHVRPWVDAVDGAFIARFRST